MTDHRPASKSAPGGPSGLGAMPIGARKPIRRAGHARGSFAPPSASANGDMATNA